MSGNRNGIEVSSIGIAVINRVSLEMAVEKKASLAAKKSASGLGG